MRLKNHFHLFGLAKNELNTIYDGRYFNGSIEDDDQSSSYDSDSDIEDLGFPEVHIRPYLLGAIQNTRQQNFTGI